MPGIKPKKKIKIKWSPNFAYAIGLLVTDGCLSKDGRHVDLTSKDAEQLKNFLSCMGIKNKVGKKRSGYDGAVHLRVQFGDVVFYRFLRNLGLMPGKSKIIGSIKIPIKHFFDFLRGELDGDGTFYSYYDPRWKSSYMFYTVFASASRKHLVWLRGRIEGVIKIKGHLTSGGRFSSMFYLKYAKKESLKLLRKVYYNNRVICLRRKRLKIDKALDIVGVKL